MRWRPSSATGARFVPLDVTDEAAWQRAVVATVETFDGLQGLLNAPASACATRSRTARLEEYRRVNDINALGTFLGCKSVIPAMKKSGGGSIVNISSVLGLRGASYAMAYCASKGAVRSSPRTWRCTAPNEVRYPLQLGASRLIDTPMIAPRLAQNAGNMTGRQMARGPASVGRLGRPEEVANMILFLLSDELSLLDRLRVRLRRRADGVTRYREPHPADRARGRQISGLFAEPSTWRGRRPARATSIWSTS